VASVARRREELEGWLFASPWLVGFVFFTLGPMLAAALFSFTDWNLLQAPRWIGLGNVRTAMLDDPLVWVSLRVTTVYALFSVPLSIALGVSIALLLNARIGGLRFYRTVYYLPSVLAGVAVALLWRWLYSPDFGLVNVVLSFVGLRGPAWLADENWALPALVIMSLWHVGGGVIVYLAGLQGIPTDLYEAAEVDGAPWWPRFRHVTVPLLTPVLFFQLIVGIIAALQVFTQALVMTNGGPHDATHFFMLYLYRNAFQFFKMGYASVLGWILFVYILALTLVVFRSSAAWVYYEGERKNNGAG
jgi:multiple sugar transport system permease protein